MNKRIISMLLVVCMVITMLPVQLFAIELKTQGQLKHEAVNPFSDVTEADWYYDSVMYAYKNGLFKGTSETDFYPNGTMTRAMYVTVMGRIAEIDISEYDKAPEFTDVKAGSYYAPYVRWATEKGITYGVGNGLFNPNGFVTRQQMAALTLRFFDNYGIIYPDVTNTTIPKDIDIVADWAKDAVLKLWAHGLFVGDNKGNFNPESNAKRSEAAELCFRIDQIVERWFVETGVKPDLSKHEEKPDTKKPEEKPHIGNEENPGTGYTENSPSTVNVSFVDGSRIIETKKTVYGSSLSSTPRADKTAKDGYVFEGWYSDSSLTTPFYLDDALTSSKTVYAKYTPLPQPELTLTSFALLNQDPDFALEVVAVSGSAQDINSAITLIPKDGSDVIPLKISESKGVYTVGAQGGFNPGSSYELTLAEGYNFKDKAASIRTASFTIFKNEVATLGFSEDIIYIQDTEEISYIIDGSTYEVLEAKHLTDESNNRLTGQFTYSGDKTGIEIDTILCFYVTESPKDRDYIDGDYSYDPEVYVKVTSIAGDTVSFTTLDNNDTQRLYFMPDTFPMKVESLPTEDNGTINFSALDRIAFIAMDKDPDNDEDTTVNIGDFVVIYKDSPDSSSESDVYYGRITAYDSDTKEITYIRTTLTEIEQSMELFLSQTVSGDALLKDVDAEALRADIERQVRESGFAEEAAFLLAELATKTNGFKSLGNVRDILITGEDGKPLSQDEIALLGIGATFELMDDIRIKVEIETDKKKLHLGDGVRVAIKIDGTFSIDVGDDGDSIKIDLSATFVEELALGTDIKATIKWKKALGFIPYPSGLRIDVAVDLKNYTAISIYVNVYTVEAEDESTWEKLSGLLGGQYKEVFDKIQDLENKIDQAKGTYEQLKSYREDLAAAWKSIPSNVTVPEQWREMGQVLGKMDITKDLMGLLSLTTETELDAGVMDLIQKYHEMMQHESDWITLLREEIFSYEYCIYGVAIGVSADFVVRGNINIALGTNLEYQVGKRYVFWIDVFKGKAGSSTMDLLDEQFAFQFYVMGKLGLKMGASARIFIGVGSGKFASIGLSTEFGPYIKLQGLFIYEYSRLRPANTNTWIYDERMAGALYLDFGLYLIVAFDAQALGGLLEYRKEFVDKEFPLLTAGSRIFNYGFATKLNPDEVLRIWDEDRDSTNGITMTFPESYRAMSQLDLVDGSLKSNTYDYDKYSIRLSNRNFSIDKNGKISVTVPNGVQYMTCNLTLTWKMDKLAFSKNDITLTIPLVWTNLSDRELNEYFTARVRVGNNIDGYTTVWQKRVKKNEPFSLPTENDIKTLIGYDSFVTESGNNLKYGSLEGYKTQNTENLTIYTDTVYDFNVSYKEYTITVEGVENADGTTQNLAFRAKYGEAFDFSSLAQTGMNIPSGNPNTAKFTRFLSLSYEGREITEPIRSNLAAQLYSGTALAQAKYTDDSVLATFTFEGIEAQSVTLRIRAGTQPSFNYASIAAAAQATVTSISPAISKIFENTDYIISCKVNEGAVYFYDIIFNTNGGSPIETATYQENSVIMPPQEPTKEGYTFGGWYTDENLSNPFLWTTMPSKNITLYAGWEPISYTVTLNANGGTFDDDENTKTITATFGQGYGTLLAPTKSGESFAGWYTAAEGGEPIYSSTMVFIAHNHTLYARWSDQTVIDPMTVMLGGLDSLVYDGQRKDIFIIAGVDSDIFTLQYKRNDSSEWNDEAINAGLYSIKVSVDTSIHSEYAPFEKTFFDVMTIGKAPSRFEIKDNQLPYTLVGKDNITIKKLYKDVDYVGDGAIEYAIINVSDISHPSRWAWQSSNKFVNANKNEGIQKEYVLAARIGQGENYLASELIVRRQKGTESWEPSVETLILEPAVKHSLNAENGYTYRVRIKTSDIRDAGTDSKIYAALSSHAYPILASGINMETFRLDDSSNNFERNDLDEFDLKTSGGTSFNPMLPMVFELYYVRAGSAPGWHCAWVEVDIYKDGKYLETSDRIKVDQWFESSTKSFRSTVQYKRNIINTGNFNATPETLVLSASDHDGVYEFIYDGNAVDQFRIGGYNALEHEYSPVLDIVSDQTGYEDCFISEIDKISFDKGTLYEKMVKNNCYSLEITITLNFNESVTTDRSKVWHKKITLSRPITD